MRINLLLNNSFETDSRSWKLATSLSAAGHRVTVLARAADGLPQVEEREGFVVRRVPQPALSRQGAPGLPGGEAAAGAAPVGPRTLAIATVGRALQALRYLRLTRAWTKAIDAVAPDAEIWQSEGLITLPVTLALVRRRGGRAVYDSRDIHVESARFARLPGPWRRLLRGRERRWARACDAVITVSEAYAGVLEPTLGRPVDAIVMNCPARWDPPDPPERFLHAALGLAEATRIVLYLGQVAPHRGVEVLIDAVGLVDRAALVVAGFGPSFAAMQALAAGGPNHGLIHFLPPVPPADIPRWNAAADVAAMPVEGATLNHRLNTPTKLFDAMGAGTPVVASDLPGMAPIIRATGAGVVCDPTDPADVARGIRDLVDAPPVERRRRREACLTAAHDVYNWEAQVERLVSLYERLARPGSPDRLGRSVR